MSLILVAKNSEHSVKTCTLQAIESGGGVVRVPVRYVYRNRGGIKAIRTAMKEDPTLDPDGYVDVYVGGQTEARQIISRNLEQHKVADIEKKIRISEILKTPEAKKEIRKRAKADGVPVKVIREKLGKW